ncbi:hypothetical protein [Streptomyces sp. V4I23]|uniref:hypothetical protein n=1 Tax=Streptomyces sp. V4I23 TaxID=3042282 RepID=UPI0027D8BC98|nr:hypothetical protein [Streptomyces sp. V4I23]
MTGDDRLDELDTCAAYGDGREYIRTVGRQTVELPGELGEPMNRLEEQLTRLADLAAFSCIGRTWCC